MLVPLHYPALEALLGQGLALSPSCTLTSQRQNGLGVFLGHWYAHEWMRACRCIWIAASPTVNY